MISVVASRFFHPLSEFERLVVGIVRHVVGSGLRVPRAAADYCADAAVGGAFSIRGRP